MASVQSAIDGNAALAGKVKASVDSANKLVFTSTAQGAGSTVAATGTFVTAATATTTLNGTAVAGTSTATGGAATGNSLKDRIISGDTSAITTADKAIAAVSTQRANLGAYQNRLEHTIANLSVTMENLSASESRIHTDMAQEMVSFTRAQLLTQASTAMLAQAPQGVLSLLR